MSFILRIAKGPVFNPKVMSESTKIAWGAVTCATMSAVTLSYVYTDSQKNNERLRQLNRIHRIGLDK